MFYMKLIRHVLITDDTCVTAKEVFLAWFCLWGGDQISPELPSYTPRPHINYVPRRENIFHHALPRKLL